MRYYIIAGEASGDLHGANLMKHIQQRDNSAIFQFWGGDRMQAVGGSLVKHYRELAFMGFLEVILNLKTILSNIKTCKQDILSFQPDVLILIDYPGFNMRIASFAKVNGIKTIYYISPQIWAWKEKRGYQLKKSVDRMLTILPFEKAFYKKFDMDVDFVGHPLLDAIEGFEELLPMPNFKEDSRPIIALLPGSRKQEYAAMLPVMGKMKQYFPHHRFVVAAAPSTDVAVLRSLLADESIEIVKGATYPLLQRATAALVTSGTATLETALFNVPQVVCYRGSWVSYWIARQLVKVKYISLVNLIMDRVVVTELIQGDFNVDLLKKELQRLLDGSARDKMLVDYKELRTLLGGPGASSRAAAIVLEELSSQE
ncbi:MAG: lipid-A-disaccharide synthase [Schleiferiaceae bacterium]|nr:lipid-A-disaccharide synthase [Schleiferiaceae bacterium]